MKSADPLISSNPLARKAVKQRAAKAAVGRRGKLTSRAAAKNSAIATELAPAVAIALLERSEQLPGKPPPALDVLAAGVTPSATDGSLRIQLLFDNGAVLPFELSVAAGAALSEGLSDEIPKATKRPRTRKA